MLPIYIKVENFTSYINETLYFKNWGKLFGVMGPNGAGKSSIIDMITTVLFYRARGTDAKGSGMDELINKSADKFKIEFYFKMSNNDYKVIREKTRDGGQTLELYINDEKHTGKLNETQKIINSIIKVDYDTFMDTICIGQGKSGNFMKKKSTERKKVIAQIMQLDKYDILEKYTKDVKKNIKNDIDNMSNNINNLYDVISNKSNYEQETKKLKKDVKDIDNNIKTKEKELEKELIEKTKYEELKKQQNSIVSRKNAINNNIQDIKLNIENGKQFKINIENIISTKENVLLEINETNKTIEQYVEEQQKLENDKTILTTKNKILSNDIQELKNKFKQLKDYDDCNCKFCGQQISSQYKENHLNEIKNEGINKQNEYNDNSQKINKLDDLILDAKTILNTNKSKLNNSQQQKSKIEQFEIKLENVINKLKDLDIRLNEYLKEKSELDDINIDILEDKSFYDNIIKNDLKNLRQELNFKKSRISVLENEIEKIKKDEILYEEYKKSHKDLKNKYDIYGELQKAWSKNGIQAIIIDNILPQMEEEINKYLGILTNDKISIHFDTLKTAKNGNTSETLDIIVTSDEGSRPYENYSGGEKMRIDFACHIGMSKFLAKRSGATMDFFVVDEGIGTLDEQGKNNFLDTLNILTTIFKQIMVISHIEDIKESFNNKVLINKDLLEGSKVSLVK